MEKDSKVDLIPRIVDLFASLPDSVQLAFVAGYDAGKQESKTKANSEDKKEG